MSAVSFHLARRRERGQLDVAEEPHLLHLEGGDLLVLPLELGHAVRELLLQRTELPKLCSLRKITTSTNIIFNNYCLNFCKLL